MLTPRPEAFDVRAHAEKLNPMRNLGCRLQGLTSPKLAVWKRIQASLQPKLCLLRGGFECLGSERLGDSPSLLLGKGGGSRVLGFRACDWAIGCQGFGFSAQGLG